MATSCISATDIRTPAVHAEFSYLLAEDKCIGEVDQYGHLTRARVESMHVIQQPTCASICPY